MDVDEPSETFKTPFPISSLESATKLDVTENADSNKSESVEIQNNEIKHVDRKITSKNSKNRVDVPLPYTEPSWSGTPSSSFSFEIIKNGTFVENFGLKKSLITFGRLDVCDIIFEHPSVSRYHAVLQYCEGDSTHQKGFYIYDLGSTHGTFLNKEKITPKIYYKLKVGYLLKFGGSTRLHIFQGPEEEEEEQKVAKANPPKEEEEVCTWGMGEDAEEEEDLSENPFALSTPNEELYLEDPKKTLRGWFEREGYEVEYDVEEKGFKSFTCRIQLPVDNPSGDFMTVEASVSGKKKEAVIACALEACRTLDRLGLLRQSHHESRQRKKKKWEENDYYDSDEDTFLDRTGTIEKKREMRKRMEKKTEAETYNSIEIKLKAVTDEINEITSKLSTSKADANQGKNSEDDTLEAYMSTLSDSAEMATDKIERRRLRFRLVEAEKEKAHLEKLLNIARPAKLPPVAKFPGMIGKRLKSKFQAPSNKSKEVASPVKKLDENEEEVEEDSDAEDTVTADSSKVKSESSDSQVDSSEKSTEIIDPEEKGSKKAYGLILNVSKRNEQTKSTTEKTAKQESSPSEESKKRVIGCVKPISDFISGSSKDISPSKKRKKEKKPSSDVDVYVTGKAEYTTWVPPANQTGDGMTHLNEKYGY